MSSVRPQLAPAGLVDDVLMVILNFPGLSIPLDGLVYRLLSSVHYCAASISAHFTKELIHCSINNVTYKTIDKHNVAVSVADKN